MEILQKQIKGKHREVKYSDVYDMANLELAVKNAKRKKERRQGVRMFNKDPVGNLKKIQEQLINKTYHTSRGMEAVIRCDSGKERKLHKLPFFPDHIIHHALMQVLMPSLIKSLYYESGASVKNKGIHYAAKRTRRWIDEHKDTKRLYYCKLDFIKFYENIDQQCIYDFFCHMYRDEGIRYLLKEIITCCEHGLGIGLYPIQTLTNAYMSKLCRQVCKEFNVKVEIYCDDMVILGVSSKDVWEAVRFIANYAVETMHQNIHDNYSVQIINENHFLDFVGYKFYINHTLLRTRMKKKFVKKMKKLKNEDKIFKSAMSYKGWLQHCDGHTLWQKYAPFEIIEKKRSKKKHNKK